MRAQGRRGFQVILTGIDSFRLEGPQVRSAPDFLTFLCGPCVRRSIPSPRFEFHLRLGAVCDDIVFEVGGNSTGRRPHASDNATSRR